MRFSRFIISKIFFVLICIQTCFDTQPVKSAEEIKIIYSIFSRNIKVDELKNFSKQGYSTKNLRRILKQLLLQMMKLN